MQHGKDTHRPDVDAPGTKHNREPSIPKRHRDTPRTVAGDAPMTGPHLVRVVNQVVQELLRVLLLLLRICRRCKGRRCAHLRPREEPSRTGTTTRKHPSICAAAAAALTAVSVHLATSGRIGISVPDDRAEMKRSEGRSDLGAPLGPFCDMHHLSCTHQRCSWGPQP